MKTKEELNAIKEEYKNIKGKLAKLSEDELKQVTGGQGMSNPVAGMPREQAERIAKELDEGTYVGQWYTMTGNEFMEWWRKSNPGM